MTIVEDDGIEFRSVNKIAWSVREAVSPPVNPIGAFNIETSMQLWVKLVTPVHKHFPLIHAPFLLQW